MKAEKGFLATWSLGRSKNDHTTYAFVEVQCEVVGATVGLMQCGAEGKAALWREALSGGAVGFEVQGGLYSALLAVSWVVCSVGYYGGP